MIGENLKTAYKFKNQLKNILLLILLINISGCKLFTGEIKARESEGRLSIGSMNRAQQRYFLENEKFTTELDMQSKVENYDLKIVPLTDTDKAIMHIAQAKREDIKNYLGLVYAIKVNGAALTISQVCEAENNTPLTSTPEIPKLIENATSEDIKCPSGFKSLT